MASGGENVTEFLRDESWIACGTNGPLRVALRVDDKADEYSVLVFWGGWGLGRTLSTCVLLLPLAGLLARLVLSEDIRLLFLVILVSEWTRSRAKALQNEYNLFWCGCTRRHSRYRGLV